jgi:glycosyltransferase involved in cell wall biosynthesis
MGLDTRVRVRPRDITPSRGLRLFDIRSLGEVVFEQMTSADADIAVIVPLYNYAGVIDECLQSVVAQDLGPLSVVVVDDASTDSGGEKASALLRRQGDRFASARVVRLFANQGLAMARNVGVVWSREPYLFMLDADNRIRRPCLSRLLEAIEASGAAFAYPQLQFFDEEHGLGLADVWDPSRFRDGNYIDAMALIRREPLVAAGGYATLANEHGWEDYDLWCRFAELGHEGVFLPEILAEYRVRKSSMLRARTAKYASALKAELTLRHPALLADDTPPREHLRMGVAAEAADHRCAPPYRRAGSVLSRALQRLLSYSTHEHRNPVRARRRLRQARSR